jgi:GTP-binding protein HflX
MAELSLLASSAGSLPVMSMVAKRAKPDPAMYMGSGKATELREQMDAYEADIAIFNHALSPVQQRNLERHLKRHVIDRTGLILDIFAQRAKSHVGKTQVELANVRYQVSRLVRAWSHLERQKGGIGLRGGPGETQMELDRRMLENKAKRLQTELEKLQRQQATQRRARERRDVFSISLVGYTNAGKSTLFNALTKAGTYAADQLFATLDTTSRRVYLPEIGNAVISDTVGFIRDLPHQLVEAFRATLDETVRADLLLHVVDAASFDREQQMLEVDKVLAEIGADQSPQLIVINKIDQVPQLAERGPFLKYDKEGQPAVIYISAKEGVGLDLLRTTLADLAKNTARIKPSGDVDSSVAQLDLKTPAKRWESLDIFHDRSGTYSPNDA